MTTSADLSATLYARITELEKLNETLLEALREWLPYILGQEGRSDETDILVDKARKALALAGKK